MKPIKISLHYEMVRTMVEILSIMGIREQRNVDVFLAMAPLNGYVSQSWVFINDFLDLAILS